MLIICSYYFEEQIKMLMQFIHIICTVLWYVELIELKQFGMWLEIDFTPNISICTSNKLKIIILCPMQLLQEIDKLKIDFI